MNERSDDLPKGIDYLSPKVKSASEHFRNTGEHAGIFESPKSADAFDKALHDAMGWKGKNNKWE